MGRSAPVRRNLNILEGNPIERRQFFHVAMIGDDDRDLAQQLAGAPAMQQIGHAVQILGAEQRHAGQASAGGQLPAHAKLGGEGGEGGAETFQIEAFRRGSLAHRQPGWTLFRASLILRRASERPLDAHEEETKIVILVLVGVQDVGASLIEQRGDARHKTLAVRAVDEQNGRIFHVHFSLSHGAHCKRAAPGKSSMQTSSLPGFTRVTSALRRYGGNGLTARVRLIEAAVKSRGINADSGINHESQRKARTL